MIFSFWKLKFGICLVFVSCILVILGVSFAHDTSAGTIIKAPSYLGLNSGLVGYWNLDGENVSGTVAKDSSGNGNNGTLAGANGLPVRTSGQVGQALKFDGADDYVHKGSPAGLPAAASNRTMSMWVKWDTAVLGTVFGGYGQASNDKNFQLGIGLIDVTKLRFYGWGTSDYESTIDISTLKGEWHNYAVTYDGTTVRLYVDGVFRDSAARTLNTGSIDFCVAGEVNTGNCDRWFKGSVDDFRIYNRVLSATEIKRLYLVGGGSKANIPTFNSGRYTGTSFDTNVGNASPSDIAFYNGFFWITDNSTDEVYKYNPDGSYTGTSFDTLADGSGYPTGIVGYDGFLYIVDGIDELVYKFRTDGTFVGIAVDTSAETLDFQSVWGIAIFDNHFWIADYGHDEVFKYKMDGSYTGYRFDLAQHGNRSAGGFIQYNGYFYIPDDVADKVFIYNTSGNFTGKTIDLSVSGNNSPYGMTYYDGYFYVVDAADSKVYKYEAPTSMATVNSTQTSGSLNNGLVGHWTFDGADISGTRAKDRSGNGNHGTITGATGAIGQVGQALSFDGLDDIVSINNTYSTVTGSGTKSVSLWAKPTSVPAGTIYLFSLCKDASTRAFGINISNAAGGRWVGNYRSTGDIAASLGSANSNASMNNWVHLVLIQNGTTVKFYMDGVEKLSATDADVPTVSSPSNAAIGESNCSDGNFAGSVDDVRLYNRALSAGEIQKLYNQGR